MNISMEEVRNYPDLPWCKEGLSQNKGLTVRDIEKLHMPNARGKWEWFFISMSIDMREVRAHPECPWERPSLSCNKGITVRDIDLISLGRHDILRRNVVPMRIASYPHDVNVIC